MRVRTNVVGGGRLREELAATPGAAARGDGRMTHRGAVPAAAVHEAVAGHVKVRPVLPARHHVVLLRLRSAHAQNHQLWRRTPWCIVDTP